MFIIVSTLTLKVKTLCSFCNDVFCENPSRAVLTTLKKLQGTVGNLGGSIHLVCGVKRLNRVDKGLYSIPM